MTTKKTTCPFLGLDRDSSVQMVAPDAAHRCFATNPIGVPEVRYQQANCLSPHYPACPLYAAARKGEDLRQPARAAVRKPQRRNARQESLRGLQAYWPWLLVGALAVILAGVVVGDLLATRNAPPPTPVVAQRTAIPTAPAALRPAQVTPRPAATAAGPAAAVAVASGRYATPTAEPGGRTVTIAPTAGDAGWWTGGDARGNHLGDSFLYAGYTAGQAFISAARFDLGSVPRGAAIRSAAIRLAGLSEDRFDPNAGGTWSVQILPDAAVPDLRTASFQALLNAPAAVTLFPTFFAADLGVGEENVAELDAASRAWLEGQLLEGAEAVIMRITGPGSGDTLFAWDSGAGPASVGEGPELVIAFGPLPATVPPLPTEAVIVATETPTPANVLTAAARAWTATAEVAQFGTPTPPQYRYVTPTATPANLATVQARALLAGFPPIVLHTPTPANAETASALEWLAAAEALLTGTPTALPREYVTPVIITPTPQPANVMTAAAQMIAATARVAVEGTPPPWAWNAVIATVTPTPYVIVPPGNQATAQALSAYATAVTMLTGTFTPYPADAVTATPRGGAAQAAPPPVATAPPGAPEPAPAPAPFPEAACPDARVQITSPTTGQRVSGEIELLGRAVHEAFAAYVVEFAPGELPAEGYTEAWRSTTAIEGGVLGVFVLTELPAGRYTLSLRVETTAGDPPPACRIVVEVTAP